MAGHSDSDLLARASTGDTSALEELLVRHGPTIRAHLDINAKWRAVLEPDDVMQVAYLEAILDFSDFRGDADAFPAWLRSIARHALQDAIRELSRRKRPGPDDRLEPPEGVDPVVWLHAQATAGATTPSGHFARAELLDLLVAEIDALPDHYAEVLRLRYVHGRPVATIAREVRATEGAVCLRLHRALERLRKRFVSATGTKPP
jgi:RNA polymerase sigma-70 factor (ECF subfamily)